MTRMLPALGTALLVVSSSYLGTTALGSVRAASSAREALTPPQTSVAPPGSAVNPDRPGEPPEELYQAILDRPLFAPSRRPMPVSAPPTPTTSLPTLEPVATLPEPKTVSPPSLALKGIVGGRDRSVAFVEQAGAEPAWLAQGMMIEDWELAVIGRDWIVLRQGEQEVRIDLFD